MLERPQSQNRLWMSVGSQGAQCYTRRMATRNEVGVHVEKIRLPRIWPFLFLLPSVKLLLILQEPSQILSLL